jgi:hypothetical protein
VNADKAKYVLLSRHQNAGQNNDLKISNISFVTIAQLKYLGKAVTNQSWIQEEIKTIEFWQ